MLVMSSLKEYIRVRNRILRPGIVEIDFKGRRILKARNATRLRLTLEILLIKLTRTIKKSSKFQ
jgi:hypothetical protein